MNIKPASRLATLTLVAAACAENGAASAPQPPPRSATDVTAPVASAAPVAPAPSSKPNAPAAPELFAAIAADDAATVRRILGEAPALAGASDAKGHSAFLAALFRQAGEGFVRPQDNALLAAVLAVHPALDPIEAAGAGDQGQVSAALAGDPDYVRRVHRIGWTPLHFAAFGGQTAIAASLLAHGADANARAKNTFDNTPLQVALLTAQGDVVRLLLSHRVDVNAKQGEGFTALHEAAQNGDPAIVLALLDAGADIGARGGEKKESALDVAVRNGRGEVVSLLRARGAR